MKWLIGIIFVAFGVSLITVTLFILDGFVFMKLWQWFIVPFGFDPLKLPYAIGIGMMISFLTNQYTPKHENDKWYSMYLYVYLHPLIILFAGWITQLFLR